VKPYRIQITARARAQMRDASRWWRENRRMNPGLFRQEMTEATARLAALPGMGTPYDWEGLGGVHRVQLPRTSYHVYYVVHEQDRVVTLMAVWHSARGHGPDR
jgi:plasmid stabilization system protein ParE